MVRKQKPAPRLESSGSLGVVNEAIDLIRCVQFLPGWKRKWLFVSVLYLHDDTEDRRRCVFFPFSAGVYTDAHHRDGWGNMVLWNAALMAI